MSDDYDSDFGGRSKKSKKNRKQNVNNSESESEEWSLEEELDDEPAAAKQRYSDHLCMTTLFPLLIPKSSS